jgi:hypothetical protein
MFTDILKEGTAINFRVTKEQVSQQSVLLLALFAFWAYSLALRMEVVCCSRMSVPFSQTTWHHIPMLAMFLLGLLCDLEDGNSMYLQNISKVVPE